MRLTHSSHCSREQLAGELEWIEYLHEKGANVYSPVHSKYNNLVEEIELEVSSFYAVSFEKALVNTIWAKSSNSR